MDANDSAVAADLEARTPDELRALVRNLMVALQSRHMIGMAEGMVRLRYGLSEEQAFQYLSRRSQQSQAKLRDVAVTVIDELVQERARSAEE